MKPLATSRKGRQVISRRSFVFLVLAAAAVCSIYIGLSVSSTSTSSWATTSTVLDEDSTLHLTRKSSTAADDDKGTIPLNINIDNVSSADYVACCGIGHRLARMAAANFVATKNKLALRSHWGWCGGDEGVVEIYSTLFHPGVISSYTNQTGTRIRFLNNVGGFQAIIRNKTTECACDDAKITADYEFFDSLRSRFVNHEILQDFRKRYFETKTVFGIHVRAGNGEGGDFARKKRGIENHTLWVEKVSHQLWDLYKTMHGAPQLLLYVATDTPSIIDLFQKQLGDQVQVADWKQSRINEGEGVYFGAVGDIANKHFTNRTECLRIWEDTLMDMMLLSYADVVISGRPSSFVQTLPMSLSFRQQPRYNIQRPYCEIIGDDGTGMQCYASYQEWCCEHDSWLDKEFVQFLPFNQKLPEYKIITRPNDLMSCYPKPGRKAKQWCLPHHWKPIV